MTLRKAWAAVDLFHREERSGRSGFGARAEIAAHAWRWIARGRAPARNRCAGAFGLMGLPSRLACRRIVISNIPRMPAAPPPEIVPEPPSVPFAFEGTFPLRKVPPAYQVGLGFGALVMVLLPVLYVALIGAAGVGVVFYARHATDILNAEGAGLWSLLAYVAPILAGVVLIVFMIKPLFSRPPKPAAAFGLDLAAEPGLRDFLATLAARVGAPMPVRVEIDCQVNASARFHRGFRSIGRRDLVLTVGLPLVAGLEARQFAGVLAHELGHFAQNAGMTFTYLISSINGWFARVVFQRDAWDAALTRLSEIREGRIMLLVWTARAAVGVGRKILHGLMYAGHASTCYLSRSMEYDADYYAIQIAGSAAFAATSADLPRLGAAQQQAWNALGELWKGRRLVDDFPGLVAARLHRLEADTVAAVDKADAAARTKWHHTHPSAADRRANAARLNLPGIFRGEGPASALFSDFPGLCRAATRHLYRAQLGLQFDDGALVDQASASRGADEAAARAAALHRLAGGLLDLHRPVAWTAADFAGLGTPAAPAGHAGELGRCRARIAQLLPAASAAQKTFGSIQKERLAMEAGCALLGASIKIRPVAFELTSGDREGAKRELERNEARLRAKAAELRDFDEAVHRWVAAVARAARDPAAAARLPAEPAARLVALTDALAGLAPWVRALPQWAVEARKLAVFVANQAKFGEKREFILAIGGLRDRVRAMAADALAPIGQTPYPFAEPPGSTTMAGLAANAFKETDRDAHLNVLASLTARTYFGLLSEIAWLGEQLEQALVQEPAAGAAPASTGAG